MKEEELAYFLAIHAVTFAGARKMQELKDYFGGFREVWEAEAGELKAFRFLPGKLDALLAARKNLDPLAYREVLYSKGYSIRTIFDKTYPEALRSLYDPPAVLYGWGKVETLDQQAIAVVGARKPSPYGRQIARSMATDLARAGFWIVSGMARGIDTEAHLGALEAGGRTVAVLGSGIDVVYPRENKGLYSRIAETGVVVSEFPPGTPPEPKNFPIRNRIISGLSKGVLVVEARVKSGALITADWALDQGRDVFAVPGPITSRLSQGTNNLIKQGAKLVTTVEDILEEYQLVLKDTETGALPLGDLDRSSEFDMVLDLLGTEPVHLDQLVRLSGLTPGQLSGMLFELQIRGIIEVLPGNYFIRLRGS
ncbi:MAG TPA: DNA-processing protein DprA [Syntrophothermus lipocalidus]|nr:DNA-processing protein DprA [Syntrophothermus lipocalidus]